MANISDLIEAFLIETLGDDDKLKVSRNELALFFACAPSQINYVLSTRFTPERGYIIESKRGGGGSVTVVRLQEAPADAYKNIINRSISEGLSYLKATQVIDRMEYDDIISDREAAILKTVMSDKTLVAPTVIKDGLRSSILKSVLLALLRSDGGETLQENEDEEE